jgi:hypothetical protein
MKKKQRTMENFVRSPTIDRNTGLNASTSGFCHSPGPPPLGDALGIIPLHYHGQKNGQQDDSVIRRGNAEQILDR